MRDWREEIGTMLHDGGGVHRRENATARLDAFHQVATQDRAEGEMKISDQTVRAHGGCADACVTFRWFFNVAPGEEIEVSPGEALIAAYRFREYTRDSIARNMINRILRKAIRNG